MGLEAIYKCNNCGNEFKSREGGGSAFAEYRCVRCDTIKEVLTSNCPATPKNIGKCGECEGELRNDLRPMCDKCRSRDVEVKEVLAEYD